MSGLSKMPADDPPRPQKAPRRLSALFVAFRFLFRRALLRRLLFQRIDNLSSACRLRLLRLGFDLAALGPRPLVFGMGLDAFDGAGLRLFDRPPALTEFLEIRKRIEILEPEGLQELRRGRVHHRPPRRFLAPGDLDESALQQRLDDAAGIHAPKLLDLRPRYRLPIGHDRDRLEQGPA